MLKIIALMDNQVWGNRPLIAEHGLSLYVSYGDCRILFDCGPGPNTLCNARELGICLKDLDGVVLSHSHYDHAGGYRALVEQGWGSARLFTGPGFFEKKYSREDSWCRDLSAGFEAAFLEQHGICHREVAGVAQVVPGLYLVGDFPRIHSFETIPARFVRESAGTFHSDDFRDEICIAAEVSGGLAVLVGCAHPGILNMVAHVQALLGKPVKAVFGGTHLVEADSSRTEATIDALREMGLEILGLSHCSGETAQAAAGNRRDIRACRLGVGDSFRFD